MDLLIDFFATEKINKPCFYRKDYAKKSRLKFHLGSHKCSENTNKNAV